MRAFCLAGDQVQACWEDFGHLFDEFERGGADMSSAQAIQWAKESKIQVWGLQDDERVHGIVSTEVVSTAHGLVCILLMAQGSAPDEDKRALLDSIIAWARELGCRKVRVQGRPGWLRWDKRFKPTGIVAEIEL